MKSTPRTRKVSESVREALADILVDEIADPRVRFVTVTSVAVSADLRHASVYVTAHGGEDEYADAMEGLKSASGRIRTALGRRVRMKYLPELHFKLDESVDEGMRITEALKVVPPSLAEATDDATEAEEDGDAASDPAGDGRALAEEETLP